jgi:PAS domain S-box-containing protein
MSGPGFQLSLLRDGRLAPLATSALPAWLWRPDGTRIVWANATGAAVFGATCAAIGSRRFVRGEPAAHQITRIAATLSAGAAPRLERLRGFGAGIGRALTCACSHIVLADNTAAVLVAAIERAGPDLPLGERVARLLAGGQEPIAAFTVGGHLMAATEGAQAHLRGATSLAGIGAGALAASALANGHAVGGDGNPISLDRIGSEVATVLIAQFAPAGESMPQPNAQTGSALASPPPATPTERRHPLRFVWQMNEGGHFTLSSDEFIALTGARTAAAIGRAWQEVATELELDPGAQVARAVATRETWSGLTVLWPVEASSERLAVELSGLPVFDRNRAFRGYRGFGVCREIAQLNALSQRRQAANAAVQDVVQSGDQADEGDGAAAEFTIAPPAENILHFPRVSEPNVPALSAIERNAFRELTRKLTQRLTGMEPADQGEVPAPIDKDEEAPAGAMDAAHTLAADGESAKLNSGQTEFAELTSLLDTAADGFVVLDAHGLIVSANRGAEALFGYEPRELAGRAFSELFAPESVETAYDCLDDPSHDGDASGRHGGREIIGRAAGGSLIPMFMTVGPTGDRTDRLGVVFRDITRWKKVEQELTEARHQAEKASSAKSDFLAKISHEIRTPLNAIIGFSEVMMAERFGPVGSERYREYLKDIHASGGHLLSLINDLLDLSKIEAGRLELTFASVSLNDLTQQCVAIMQPQANRDRIIIRTSLPPSLPQVVVDARSVRQIVLNLLSNSIKFTDAGGQVIVSTALNDNGDVALRVRDTGVGMSETDLATALEPFRQLVTPVSGISGGTGLGLPLTKALAEANRASFYIKSAPKAGTLVEIAFPPSRVLAG